MNRTHGIILERTGHVAVVTFARPERRNALDFAARERLGEVFAELEADADIRCVVLTGTGSAFCAGTDLSGGVPPAHLAALPLVAPVSEFSRPVIAAVNGAAAGGGFEFVLACDLRIAAPNATFVLPELRIGSLPGSGGTQRPFAALPSAIAARLLYTGEPLDADDGLRFGLVSEVVAADALVDRALAIAARIAEAAPLSLRAAKRATRAATDHVEGFALERRLWAELAETDDRAEGRAAFREKRPPRFEGR